ncbi:MAG: glycosyltransferase family 2 protein [Crenarchaeota archaeon]|nr:glycosyltransferase family 2 protein [Thermoproteota archaeon]
MEASIIIPTLNEERNIANVLLRIPRIIWEHGEVIVADSSSDRTPIIAKKLGAKVVRVERRGKGYAMREGARYATKNKLIFMDGDRQDPPEYIPLVVKALDLFDVVLCARHPSHPAGDLFERVISLVSMNLMRLFFSRVHFYTKGDPLPGFRGLRRPVWEKMNIISDNFLIEAEMNIKIVRLGLKVLEIPIPIIPRPGRAVQSRFLRQIDQLLKIIAIALKGVKKPGDAKFYFLDCALHSFIPPEKAIMQRD